MSHHHIATNNQIPNTCKIVGEIVISSFSHIEISSPKLKLNVSEISTLKNAVSAPYIVFRAYNIFNGVTSTILKIILVESIDSSS